MGVLFSSVQKFFDILLFKRMCDELLVPSNEPDCGRSDMCDFPGWVRKDCHVHLAFPEVTAWVKQAT